MAWLRAEGYAPGTATSVACTAARLGVWMAEARLGLEDLDDAVLDRFVAAQVRGPARHPSSVRRIVAVRKFLTAVGLLNVAQAASPALTPVDWVLQAWRPGRVMGAPMTDVAVELWEQIVRVAPGSPTRPGRSCR